MATVVWKESPADGDWTNNSNYEGGVAPGAGDTVIIPKGSFDIDGSDESGTALAAVYVHNEYTGDIGSSVTPLILDVNYVSIDTGGQEVWMSLQNGAAAANIVVDIGPNTARLASGSSLDAAGVHLDTNSTDKLNPVTVRNGDVKITDSANLVEVDAKGGHITVGESVSGFTTFQSSGSATTATLETTPSTDCHVKGGTVTVSGVSMVTCADVDVDSGTLNWACDADITDLRCDGGRFDATNARGAYTIANEITIGDGTVDLAANIGQPTLTNGYKLVGTGTINFDSGHSYSSGPTYAS